MAMVRGRLFLLKLQDKVDQRIQRHTRCYTLTRHLQLCSLFFLLIGSMLLLYTFFYGFKNVQLMWFSDPLFYIIIGGLWYGLYWWVRKDPEHFKRVLKCLIEEEELDG